MNNIIKHLENSNDSEVIEATNSKLRNHYEYYFKSRPGINYDGSMKLNQDSYLTIKYDCNKYSIFSVLDGHGTYGKMASRSVSEFIMNFFNKERISHFYEENHNSIYQVMTGRNYKFIKSCFAEADAELSNSAKYDFSYSGTTVVLVILIGKMFPNIENKIICTNVGDSRAILAKYIKDIVK